MTAAITLDTLTARLDPATCGYIRATVAKRYRADRRFDSPTSTADRVMKGWAQQFADDFISTGAFDVIDGYFYLVTLEYVAAAERLRVRRALRRTLVRAS